MSEPKGAFDALVAELGISDLAKALPPAGDDTAGDDGKIQEAAEEGAGDGEAAAGEEDETLGKSFTIKLEDGTELAAVDGAALVKSLVERVETNESTTLTALKGLADYAKSQGELIKSLQSDLARLGGAGKGRKAVLTITEKPAGAAETLAKAESQKMDGTEFLAKAMVAHTAGRITSRDVSVIEQCLNMGVQPRPELVRAVVDSAA